MFAGVGAAAAARCEQVSDRCDCALVCVQVWPYLLGYYEFGATPDECRAQDDEARRQYEATVSEWLAVEAIVTQCDREALEANIARLSAEQNAAATAGAVGASLAEAAVRSAAAALDVPDEGVETDEPGEPESAAAADDGPPAAQEEAVEGRQRGKVVRITRLTDDGFGGSLSSDGGGSKQDTPVGVSTAGDAGRRQKFFVTNPTVDDATASSSSAAAAAAAAAAAVEFERCTFTQLPSDGTVQHLAA